jgi:hypothetical protein
MGNYTVWPAREGLRRANKRFSVELKGEYSTHRFTWNSTGVTFQFAEVRSLPHVASTDVPDREDFGLTGNGTGN